MTDLGTCVLAAIVCYTFRSVFFRWAEYLEHCNPKPEEQPRLAELPGGVE